LAGAAAVAGILAVVFGLVAIHVLLAQNQFELDRLNARSAVAEAQYDRLRLQVAQLESPERVVAAAEGRLGMVLPPKVTYLTPNAPAGPASSGSAPPPAKASAASPSVSADWARVKAQLGARP
jgi:cell division protein FtsL